MLRLGQLIVLQYRDRGILMQIVAVGGPMHKFGVHLIPTHGRPTDLDYIAALQPKSVKIVGNLDVQGIANVHSAAPNALIVLRNYVMSEQKTAQETDPANTGRRHGVEWDSLIATMRSDARRRGLRFPENEQICILGINEPNLEAPNLPLDQRIGWMRNAAAALDLYTASFLATARNKGYTGGAFSLSNGSPTNWDFKEAPRPGAAPDWGLFPDTHAALVRTKGILFLHEYWADLGPAENWGWWAGRFLKCPWNVPIIIGECGLDMLAKKSVDDQKRGWQAWVNKEQYADHIRFYHQKTLADSRIHSIQLYTTDYGSPWQSFDLAPVQPSIVAYARTVESAPAPSGTAAFVIAPDGLNLRADASTDAQIIQTMRYGDPVTAWSQKGDWALVTVGNTQGYAFAKWLGTTKPDIDRTLFDRAFSLVIGSEGIYSNDPNDAGNWTGGKPNAGTLKGTKYGISAAMYPALDIAALTLEDAKAIYYRDYWQTSGADRLTWPMAYVQFDTSVLHGVPDAQRWLSDSGGQIALYMALRLEDYARAPSLKSHAAGWLNRAAKVLRQWNG